MTIPSSQSPPPTPPQQQPFPTAPPLSPTTMEQQEEEQPTTEPNGVRVEQDAWGRNDDGSGIVYDLAYVPTQQELDDEVLARQLQVGRV